MDPAMVVLTRNPPSAKPSGQNARFAKAVYEPLNKHRKQIRLLTVRPSLEALVEFPLGLISQPVCTLQVVSLLDNPVYDCISYCWGSSDELLDIIVSGVKMQVTVNLNDALRQFRCDAQAAGEEPVRLWADAICINQHDIEEKNSQVAMMKDIYSQAAGVRIWLGAARNWNANLEHGFNMVEKIGTEGKSLPARVKKFLVKPILGLGTVFENPYWRRRWVTQEIALAKTLTMHFGPVNQSLTVEDELENLKMFGQQIVFRYGESTQRRPGIFPPPGGDEPTWHEWLAIDKSTKTLLAALHPITSARTLIRLGKVSELLQLVRGAEASVRHDHVYGLLGMIPAEPALIPDYAKPWEEAFADFAYTAMRSMGNLSLLYYASSSVHTLPTWTPDWSVEVDVNNDPVGVQDDYYAAAGTTFSLSTTRAREIQVRGSIVDSVKALGATISADLSRTPTTAEIMSALAGHDKNRVLKRWIALYSNHRCTRLPASESADEIDEAMLRTLLADVGDRQRIELRGQIMMVPRRLTTREVRAFTQQLNRYLKDSSSNSDVYDNVMHRMRKYSFFMTGEGRPGMAKQSVKEGDKICIVSSCNVPYCLRPQQRDGRVVYELISSCYIDGIVDGQAILNAYAIAETILDGDATEADIFEDLTLI